MENLNEKKTYLRMLDLLFYILRKWRIIVLFGFGCALLFGAFKAIQLLSMTRSAEYQHQAWTLYEQAVDYHNSETERLNLEIAKQEKQLEMKCQYWDNSVLMAMDPSDSCVASFDVCISGIGALVLSDIAQSSLKNGTIVQELAGFLETERQYVSELFRISHKTYSVPLANEGVNYYVLLHIGLITRDEKLAKALADKIISAIQKMNEEFDGAEQVNIRCLNYICIRSDVEELKVYQDQIQKDIENIAQKLENLEKDKDDLETPVYELMPLKTVFLSSLKYFLFGGFAGGCLSLILLFFVCLYSDKILSPEELEERTNMKVFTILGAKEERLGARIDKLIINYELKNDLALMKLTSKMIELDDDGIKYVIWGKQFTKILSTIIPDIEHKTILDMDEINSWRGLLPEKYQEESKELLKYILLVDRDKTTYKELNYKIGVIRKLNGMNIMCVLCV